jgi:hypothetical protein
MSISFQSKEYRLMVSENKVLRRIFGLEKSQIIGGWEKLYKEILVNILHQILLLLV